LHQFDSKLNNVAAQQKNDLEISSQNVNDILTKLVGLNKVIGDDVGSRTNTGEYYGPNELLDQRNLLLDELSRYGDTQVKQNSDGTVTVNMSGHTVIDGEKKEILNFKSYSDGTVGLKWNSDGKRFSSPTGSLQGALDMINGRGPYAQNANECAEKGILFFKDKINTFANTLASTFNNIIPGVDENGKPNFKQLLGARTVAEDGKVSVEGSLLVTAANISLSTAWASDSNYVIFKAGDKDPKYANALSAALTSNKQNFVFSGSSTNMTFEEFINDYVGICGSDHSFNGGRLDASAAIADDLLDRRDEISAVSPDEETANMMLYNKSYQAVARLMTTLDEALDILINRTGMVGR
ncbi:MAG: flagellar basal body rod C-terminal domain-containing protein, partial [Oscillospiraceae bacterium]